MWYLVTSGGQYKGQSLGLYCTNAKELGWNWIGMDYRANQRLRTEGTSAATLRSLNVPFLLDFVS